MGGTVASAQTLNVQSWVVDGSRLQVVAENQCPRVGPRLEDSWRKITGYLCNEGRHSDTTIWWLAAIYVHLNCAYRPQLVCYHGDDDWCRLLHILRHHHGTPPCSPLLTLTLVIVIVVAIIIIIVGVTLRTEASSEALTPRFGNTCQSDSRPSEASSGNALGRLKETKIMAAKARVMQRLWRLLQRLPLERRRKVLERFTASQKRALECWILGNAVAVPQAFGHRREQSLAVGTGSSQNIVRYKRGKVTYYAAQMQLGSGLRMLSKTERSLQVAQNHELLLRRVRETCRNAVVHQECMGQAKRRHAKTAEGPHVFSPAQLFGPGPMGRHVSQMGRMGPRMGPHPHQRMSQPHFSFEQRRAGGQSKAASAYESTYGGGELTPCQNPNAWTPDNDIYGWCDMYTSPVVPDEATCNAAGEGCRYNYGYCYCEKSEGCTAVGGIWNLGQTFSMVKFEAKMSVPNSCLQGFCKIHVM
eukprot:s1725_g6.t1